MNNKNIEKNYGAEFNLICEYIKIRNKSNLSQSELARRVGIAKSTVGRMEKNLHSMSLGNFVNLLSALGYELKITKKK